MVWTLTKKICVYCIMRLIQTITCCNGSNAQQRLNELRKRIEMNRSVMERARKQGIMRIRDDVKNIVKREVDYSKHMLEQLVPIKIEVNDDVINVLKMISPIRIVSRTDSSSGSDNSSTSTSSDVLANDSRDNSDK